MLFRSKISFFSFISDRGGHKWNGLSPNEVQSSTKQEEVGNTHLAERIGGKWNQVHEHGEVPRSQDLYGKKDVEKDS